MKRKTRLDVLLGHAPDDDQLDRKLMAARCDGTREDFASDFLSVHSKLRPRCFDVSHTQLMVENESLRKQVNSLRRQNSRLRKQVRDLQDKPIKDMLAKSRKMSAWDDPKHVLDVL